LWSDELDEAQIYDLASGYGRRKRWEARLLAVEVARTLFGEKKEEASPEPQVTGDAFLQMMGATVKHGSAPG
jgi:hypothetical protein